MKTSMVPVSSLKGQYATTVNIKVIMRILVILRETGRINRTNLAGKSGLNYTKCIRYVNLLQLLGWIKVIYDDSYFVIVTERGIEVIEKFTNL